MSHEYSPQQDDAPSLENEGGTKAEAESSADQQQANVGATISGIMADDQLAQLRWTGLASMGKGGDGDPPFARDASMRRSGPRSTTLTEDGFYRRSGD